MPHRSTSATRQRQHFQRAAGKASTGGRQRVARARSCIHTGDTIGEQGDPLEESQVIGTRFISRTRWLHVRALEGVDGRCRHVQPVARGSDQLRSSEGASQHLQGVDHGQTHGGHQERWRRARDCHRLHTPSFDRQNSCNSPRTSECAPFQFALSTRAGTDCVGHLLRAATDVNPNATVLSVDGVGAYDHILRAAMMSRLARMPNAKALLPFVLLSYSAPSEYDWYDDEGRRRTVTQ